MNDNARPPLVNFERRAEEDRSASLEANRYVAKDVDIALVTQPGSKDRVERPVLEWFEMLAKEVDNGRFPLEWLQRLRTAYKAWQTDQEIPENGTPVGNWPMLSPAQVTNLRRVGLMTVEDVAAMNEQAMAAYGMGARELKSLAEKYLASGAGDALAVKLQAAQAENESLKTRIESLEGQMAALIAKAPESKIETPAPAPTPAVPKKV